MSSNFSEAMDFAYAERNNLLVLALTGRTGSGCTTTASILSKNIKDIPFSDDDLIGVEKRKLEICTTFTNKQWVPFKTISVSTIIYSFLLQEDLEKVKEFFVTQKISNSNANALLKILEDIKKENNYEQFRQLAIIHNLNNSHGAWDFYSGPLSRAAQETRRVLLNQYAPLFQTMGDNIRKSGSAIQDSTEPKKIFDLIVRVKRIAKAAGKWDRKHGNNSTRIAIDAIRNPLELVYLRDQFAAFFVIAVTANEEDRNARLVDIGMAKFDIESLDKREYSTKDTKKYNEFVSQNLKECIQKSDIFFHNNGKPENFEKNRLYLQQQIIRYIALILKPGLVSPTADERCMQLAFVAKLNSGCISRQVGAAITDSSKSIKAVGWNDVPRGQVSCLLRDCGTLLNSHDEVAFSHFEQTNSDFKNTLRANSKNSDAIRTLTGMSVPFCFKDTYNLLKERDDRIHTRSLHAEENAFLQLAKYGNSGIDGGQLYTTASPCELCSKKAFQLGIKEIVYVDPYPGISSVHILASGEHNLRPKIRLFGGAVGNAYHRLYEPILPVKDELNARLSSDSPPATI